ncbi:prepilin-type N-terminal cleavage/methylation domain-containing protein [Ruminococcus sp.]|uniref:prepilin-type N-terminal cleavage/methylation domain-containing protein n=1 Tax=Ruminococcus sp. TaxID=41978 RepID=UPI0025EFC55E|nr:prepilin-type N-terminal cleavage/methylation domain-containing protein [Ruminococcus sp.]MBQ8965757.1 prepilin-type N-terminal cleavage/methylation domain-containing protein [Ruminococcus sp.]
MKMNKKGMTLVECIIAMAVFAIATTGFTMAATTCIRAQTKFHTRNKIANNQSTDLEHFANYSDVVDLSEYSVTTMDPNTGIGKNMYQITYAFPSATVTNSKVHGYRAEVDSDDKVFELSFLSPINTVSLDSDEYWFTLYNVSGSDVSWDWSCSTDYSFFDNEKASTQQTLPNGGRIWADGSIMRFGIKSSVGDLSGCTAHVEFFNGSYCDIPNMGQFLNINEDDPDDDQYGYIFYMGGHSFWQYHSYNG